MALKPWYKVVNPRADLREGKPIDASEFAVHLDQVRDGRAQIDYQKPDRFFDRTYMTEGLVGLASEVIRRLSGEKTETSAIFNMTTQFGGGKTHALTLLYHLAENGSVANGWMGVNKLLSKAGIHNVPKAKTAVFVGTEFDSLTGRGGSDGTPLRKTPWGEIAFQLGGAEAFSLVTEHEKKMIAPAGDVIREFLPKGKPCLILMDELMNYVSRNRKSGLATQLYSFLQNLSETARGEKNVVLAVSVPASELEMTADDQSDYARLKKLLDRLGKAVIMSAESETSEIIRRRLFEWDPRAVAANGKVMLSREAEQTCSDYADWVVEHHQQIPSWFPKDSGRTQFLDTYPFHPMVISVFERKWQALARFQRTRGILRLLALWVSRAFQEGFKGAHQDPLIGLGTAPLDDPQFRAAVFEQLGESRLEAAVATDICGKKDAHAVRLDKEAVDSIRKARLHRKVACTVFFESNGGQARGEATLPEIRLAVAEPNLDIGNVETVLESLGATCYFLSVEKNRYRFSLKPNLNKLLADRRASIKPEKIEEAVRAEIQKTFATVAGVNPVFFPDQGKRVNDQPALTIVVLSPDRIVQDPKTREFVETMTRECGASARSYKNALVFVIADGDELLKEEARKSLAWGDIQDEADDHGLDEPQKRQVAENLKKAERDLKESVWRAYKNVAILDKDNSVRFVDLGLVHGADKKIIQYIIDQLRKDDTIADSVSPNRLVKNWPPAFKEWSTNAVRNAFFSSPLFPKILSGDIVKATIASGVTNGLLAYVGKAGNGNYEPFIYAKGMNADDVEIADDVYIVRKEDAEAYKTVKEGKAKLTTLIIAPSAIHLRPQEPCKFSVKGLDQHGRDISVGRVDWSATGGVIDTKGMFIAGEDKGGYLISATVADVINTAMVTIAKEGEPPPVPPLALPGTLRWTGEVTPQKWMNFYTKVLTKFVTGKGLKLKISIEVSPEGGISKHTIEETKVALRELGLKDDIET